MSGVVDAVLVIAIVGLFAGGMYLLGRETLAAWDEVRRER